MAHNKVQREFDRVTPNENVSLVTKLMATNHWHQCPAIVGESTKTTVRLPELSCCRVDFSCASIIAQ